MPLRMLSPQSLSDETITDKLLSGHHGYEDHAGGDDLATPKYQAKWRCLAIVSSGLLAVSLLFNIFQYRTSLQKGAGGPYVYSPAQDAVEYEVKVFHSNFGSDRTPYQGPPNDEVDAAWEALYNDAGISRVDKEVAGKLPNRTARIPGDEDYYIVGLDVMHQLHCLNRLRKTLYPDRYHVSANLTGGDLTLDMDHIEHCVDSIRQSLMCSGDISTIYWQWDPARQRTIANAKTTHVCRRFETIQSWARDHVIGDWDPTINTQLQT